MKKLFLILTSTILIFNMFMENSKVYAEFDDSNWKTTEALNETQKELEKAKKEIERLQEEEKIKRVKFEYDPNFPNLIQENSSQISLDITNYGETNLKFFEVEIASLPAGVSLKKGKSPQQSLGDFNVGDKISCKYDLNVNKDAEVGSFPVTFNFKAKYGPNNLKEYTTSKTFYITINKNENKKNKIKLKPVTITNINHPSIVEKGKIVDFNFSIVNQNQETIPSVKVTVTPEEGLINQSQNVFVINNFAPSQKRDFSVKLFPKDGAEKKNYSINIVAEDISEREEKDAKKVPTSSQYSGIFYNAPKKKDEDEENKGVKNPQIIITNYSYGDSNVTPGENFTLSMNFINTSKSKTLQNIKISTSSEENIFIPLNSSNSFFIDSLTPNEAYSKSITFTCKADAPTKTVPVEIDYTYEDTSGNALQAKETISIPVVQKTIFSVDDVMKPYDGMEGDPVPISVNFYNLGKTAISNLMITSSGSFTVDGDSTYFVGNMDAGKSDSYSINTFPEDPHHINGKITFTFEKVDGKKETVEKEFDFELNPIPMQDPTIDQQIPEKQNKISPIFIISGIVIAFVVVILVLRHRKKKKEAEFDLDE